MKLAVIDLGTNTFHLLIVKTNLTNEFVELHRQREYVYIGEEGVDKLGDIPMQRGYEALQKFKTIIDSHEVEKTQATGTAALRRASNGAFFIKEVKRLTDISIKIISGKEEARLIYLGVRQAVPMNTTPKLIMDIGGGSVEFIIANQAKVLWAESFPIGVSVLFNQFHQNDPISNSEIETIYQYLTDTLSPLFKALHASPIVNLIGASGTFDVIANILGIKEKAFKNCQFADLTDFPTLYQRVAESTLAERLNMSDIPTQRAKLIPVALILIDFILQRTDIKTIWVSHYAMKEGILMELMTV